MFTHYISRLLCTPLQIGENGGGGMCFPGYNRMQGTRRWSIYKWGKL